MARPSAASNARSRDAITASTLAKTVTIALNDDAAEKARRLQTRQAIQDQQMNRIVAAATPRKGGDQFSAPNQVTITPGRGGGVNVVANDSTPVKKVPILANFEEWMKMATDNKINATNSWNFALIDYFHDMSLLKEGNSVNFQKASCTLDGCVKIYTSRVDSVATETGKLLSGLADSSSKSKKGDQEDGEGNEDGDDEDGEGQKKQRKRATRSEATLVKDFSIIQLKKFELEFAVDPLFKKASADFDEGGAKGLLLNHLSIDNSGKIVFDSSDDVEEAAAADADTPQDEEAEAKGIDPDVTVKEEPTEESNNVFIDIGALGAKFFPNLSLLDEQDICPSLKNFSIGDASSTIDIPFLKALSEKEEEAAAAAANNFNDDNDSDFGGGFDVGGADMGDESVMFGQGGEVWAAETMADAAHRLMTPAKGHRILEMDGDDMEDGGFDAEGGEYIVRLGNREAEQDDIMAYFDEALKKNWAGPEHWRIRRIKDGATTRTEPKVRKEKTPFTIDFSTPDPEIDDLNILFAQSNASINMPRTQVRAKNRNLLPDDKHFNSRQLLKLFLKPKALLRSRKAGAGRNTHSNQQPQQEVDNDVVMDEGFWANNEIAVTSTPEGAQGNYDANFFHDDDLPPLPEDDDDDFADAREMFSPDLNGEGDKSVLIGQSNQLPGMQAMEFGSQLVTSSRRVRPEYVQYARVAKKVDVRRLKETLWKGMEFESIDLPPQTPGRALQLPTPPPMKLPEEIQEGPRKFTEIINNLQAYYPKQAMADISTSYCFISLLHLANEKGLIIVGDGSLKELVIERDLEAEGGGEY